MKSPGTQVHVYSMHTSVDACTQYVSQDVFPTENRGLKRNSEPDVESTNSSIDNGIDRKYFVLETSYSHRSLPCGVGNEREGLRGNMIKERGAIHRGNRCDNLYYELQASSSVNRDYTGRSGSVKDTVICETLNSESDGETNKCDFYNNDIKNTYFVLEKSFNAENESVLSNQQDFKIDNPQCLEQDTETSSNYFEINENFNINQGDCLSFDNENSQFGILDKEHLIKTEQEGISMSAESNPNESSYFVLEKQFASKNYSMDVKVPIQLQLCSNDNEYDEIQDEDFDHLQTTDPQIMRRKSGNAYDHIKL